MMHLNLTLRPQYKLDKPIMVYGAVRDMVIMEHKFINRVASSKNA